MKNYFKNKRGISLVEVVAAVALLTIVTTAVFNVLIQSSKLNERNDALYSANTVARDLSAEITNHCQNIDFTYPADINEICFPENTTGTPPVERYEDDYNGFQVIFEIQNESAASVLTAYHLRQVKISVWDQDDDPDVQPPKAVTYTYQREVLQ